MSLREIVQLAQIETDNDRFGPMILKMAFDLIKQLADICEQNNIRLHQTVTAFETVTNDWQIALLQIFEVFCQKDFVKAKQRDQ